MPVTLLLVEGELDAQILQPVLAGHPVVEATKSSKYALAPRTRTEREKRNTGAYYLRDRDYDFLPPSDCAAPVVDKDYHGKTLGWRWCKHEIENYMLEPAIVAGCLGLDRSSYEQSLLNAARSIRYYQAARWTIGQSRKNLPPHYGFDTRPDEAGNKDFYLPRDIGQQEMKNWARQHADSFRSRVLRPLDQASIEKAYDRFAQQFDSSFFDSPANPLVWFSGKDLMAALGPLLPGTERRDPGQLRASLRDWMKENTEIVLGSLQEWRHLKKILQGEVT
ncbi:MAG: hypothetical protein AB1696_23225 [Planctomycetota bacterium]